MGQPAPLALNIEDSHCRLLKIANNLEKHGDEDVPWFTIPVEGLMLTREQSDVFAPGFYDDCFIHGGPLIEVKEWAKILAPFKIPDRYEGTNAIIDLSNQPVSFSDCRLSSIALTPLLGGLMQMDCHLQVDPGLDGNNLLLQKHQNREVKLSLESVAVSLKKRSRQQELPLQQASETPPDDGPEDGENEEVAGDSPDIQPAPPLDTATRSLEMGLNREIAEHQKRKRGRPRKGETRAH